MKRILLLFICLFTMLIPQPVMADDANWIIAFNSTGTYFKDNYLKITLSIYPPEGTKSYEVHHVYVVDETSLEWLAGYPGKVDEIGEPLDDADYQKWLDGLPHIWRTNPAHNHSITVPYDITVEQLNDYIKIFDADFLASLDLIWEGYETDTLIKPVSDYLSPLMKDKTYLDTGDFIAPVLQPYIIEQVNTRFIDYAVIDDGSGGIAQTINPQSITIGPGATDRTTAATAGYTLFDLNNAADGDGTIDTWELWFASAASGTVEVATGYGAVDDAYTRDSETIGAVSSGSKQTFSGKSTDVATGDYAVLYEANGAVERDNSGAGYWYYYGDGIPASGLSCTLGASRTISIYGTGGGGATYDIVNVPVSEALGTVNASATYYAFGSAPSNPVEDGECTFTVNNTGTATANVTIKCTDFTGGVGWTLTSDSPGENTVRITAYYSGQNPASGVVLTTSEQDFCTVNASGSLMWDFKIETGTFTDGVEKSANITLTSYEL